MEGSGSGVVGGGWLLTSFFSHGGFISLYFRGDVQPRLTNTTTTAITHKMTIMT